MGSLWNSVTRVKFFIEIWIDKALRVLKSFFPKNLVFSRTTGNTYPSYLLYAIHCDFNVSATRFRFSSVCRVVFKILLQCFFNFTEQIYSNKPYAQLGIFISLSEIQVKDIIPREGKFSAPIDLCCFQVAKAQGHLTSRQQKGEQFRRLEHK